MNPNHTLEHLIEHNLNAWVTTRRDIHAHPELCFEEHRTAGLVAERLRSLGYAVETGVGGTGVVGFLSARAACAGQTKRPCIGLRADMDALPIQERTPFAHASRPPGKMHACGHDGHVAMLLAAAQVLVEGPPLPGDVVLIFQPAEEGGGGAQRMIEDGLFERYPVDAVFAFHNWPGLAEGQVAVHSGAVMASSNEFYINIHGKGAHAAMPHLGVDPVVVAAQLIVALQTVVSRSCKPSDAAVLSITQMQAGQALNAIPEEARLAGTVRTFSEEALNTIEQHLRTLSNQLCGAFGATATVRFERNYPPTLNHPDMAQFAARALQASLGAAFVRTDMPPSMGAEDFAYMLLAKPGAYLWLGNGEGEHRCAGHGLGPCTLHNPSYDFNDRVLPTGLRAWLGLVHAFFAENGPGAPATVYNTAPIGQPQY